MATKLTKNFTLEECCYSDTAKKLGIQNIPDESGISKLKLLCEKIAQPIRDHYGKPVTVNSGYRGPELNKAVGGASKSQHCKCEALDLEIKGVSNYDLAMWIKDNLDFDQLILEYADNIKNDKNSGWVHVSYSSESTNRHQVLTINKKIGTKVGLIK